MTTIAPSALERPERMTIARRMVLSPKTVRNHVSNVLTKLAIPDRATAIIRARDEGLGQD